MSSTEETIKSISQYIKIINKLDDEKSFIYRGQKNHSWQVESGAIRRLKEGVDNTVLLNSLFIGYIHQSINEVQIKYPVTYKGLEDLECMAHLQHHRVATALIDFSKNPLVALFFACHGDYQNDDGKVIIVQKDNTIEEIKTTEKLREKLNYFFKDEEKYYLWQPTLGNPAMDTQRITAQQSVFLFGQPIIQKERIYKELIISNKFKSKILKELAKMGILEKTLFPDLLGFFERNTANTPYDKRQAEYYYTEKIKESSDE